MSGLKTTLGTLAMVASWAIVVGLFDLIDRGVTQ